MDVEMLDVPHVDRNVHRSIRDLAAVIQKGAWPGVAKVQDAVGMEPPTVANGVLENVEEAVAEMPPKSLPAAEPSVDAVPNACNELDGSVLECERDHDGMCITEAELETGTGYEARHD